MATVADLTEINQAVDTIITDGGILHDVIHGAVGDPPITVESGEVNNLATALSQIMSGTTGVTTGDVNVLIAAALHVQSIETLEIDNTGLLTINYIDELGTNHKSVDLSNLVTAGSISTAIVMEDLTNTDLNTVVTPGWYRIVSGNTNFPPLGQQGAMRVVSTGTDTSFRQDYYERDTSEPHHYTRSTLNTGTTWNVWQQALHTETLGTSNQVLTSTGSGYDWADPGPGTTYSAGESLELSGNVFNVDEATFVNRGSVELATETETHTGDREDKAVTPAGLKSVTDSLVISGGGGISTVNTDSTIDGDGDTDPLSVANPFTQSDEDKLDGVESGAQRNVGQEFTTADETKLDGIQAGAEVNIKSNWAEPNAAADSFIENKPGDNEFVPTNGTENQVLTKGPANTRSWQDPQGGSGGGGPTYTPGEGIDIESDVISIENATTSNRGGAVLANRNGDPGQVHLTRR